jgi:hypothetical protein
MPSQHQSADTSERLRCPNLQAAIGEDPVRWLDWDFLRDQGRKALVWSVVTGIDTFERLNAWRAVERRLANDCYAAEARNPPDRPRNAIMRRLDQQDVITNSNGTVELSLPSVG